MYVITPSPLFVGVSTHIGFSDTTFYMGVCVFEREFGESL